MSLLSTILADDSSSPERRKFWKSVSLIIQIYERVRYMTKNPANVLLPSSQRSACTICVFINKNHVQKCVGGGGGAQAKPIGWRTHFTKWVGNCGVSSVEVPMHIGNMHATFIL